MKQASDLSSTAAFSTILLFVFVFLPGPILRKGERSRRPREQREAEREEERGERERARGSGGEREEAGKRAQAHPRGSRPEIEGKHPQRPTNTRQATHDHTTTRPHNHTTVRPHNHAHHTFTQTNTKAGDIEPPISAAEAGPSATIVRHPSRVRHLVTTFIPFFVQLATYAPKGGTTDAPHCDVMASTMRLTIDQLELERSRVQIKLRKTVQSPRCSFLVTCAPMGAQRTRHAATQRHAHG